jgi:hypothetical protein
MDTHYKAIVVEVQILLHKQDLLTAFSMKYTILQLVITRKG